MYVHTGSLYVHRPLPPPLALLLLRVGCVSIHISRSLEFSAPPPVLACLCSARLGVIYCWAKVAAFFFCLFFVSLLFLPSSYFRGEEEAQKSKEAKNNSATAGRSAPLVIILVISPPPELQLRPLWEGRSHSHHSDWRVLCLSSRTTRHSPPHP